MENTTKLLINHTFCHLMLIPAFLYGELWMFVASFFWWYVVAIVAISGGFDPVHVRHVRMIAEAARMGDVIIIANSDAWLMRKKGYVFLMSGLGFISSLVMISILLIDFSALI